MASTSAAPVEVLDQLTPYSTTFALPDGTYEMHNFESQVHMQNPDGTWADIDENLLAKSGRLVPAVSPAAVSFSEGGDDHDAAIFETGEGQLALSWPGNLPTPLVRGPIARYNDVQPGVDMLLTALPGGFRLDYVLTAKPPIVPTLTLTASTTDGLVLSSDSAGALHVAAPDGTPVLGGSIPIMYDAIDEATQTGAHDMPLTQQVVTEASGAVDLVLSPDAHFLNAASTVYPVTLDPTIFDQSDTIDNYNVPGSPTPTTPDTSDWLKSGMRDSTSKFRSLMHISINNSALSQAVINSATLHAHNQHAAGMSCTKRQTDAFAVTSSWDYTTATWNNQPTYSSSPIGTTTDTFTDGNTNCPPNSATWNITDAVRSWVADPSTEHGIMLRADDMNDTQAWRIYDSKDQSYNGGVVVPPEIDIDYCLPSTPPRSVTAVATSSTSASVTWQAPTTSNTDDGHVNGYQVTRRDVSLGRDDGAWGVGNVSSFSDTGLTMGHTYSWRVHADNGCAPSDDAFSNQITMQSVPSQPLNVVASSGDQTATVDWGDPLSNGGSAITDYYVQKVHNGQDESAPVRYDPATHEASFSGLVNGDSYAFRVWAKNANGSGQPVTSNAVVPSAKPGPPQNPSVSTGCGQATVSWDAPGSNGGASVDTYYVDLSLNGSAQSETPVTATSATHYATTLTGLQNGTGYSVTVSAHNVRGTGQPSSPVQFTPSCPPGAPGNVQVTNGLPDGAGNATVTVFWTAAPDNGAAIDKYTVQPEDNTAQHNPVGLPTTVCGTCTSAAIGGLAFNTTYVFAVKAHNVNDYGPPATSAPYTTDQIPVVTKSVNLADGALGRLGQDVKYTLSVHNTNAFPIYLTSISDELPDQLDVGPGELTGDIETLAGSTDDLADCQGLCHMEGRTFTVGGSPNSIMLPANGTKRVSFFASLVSSGPDTGRASCDVATNVANVSGAYGVIPSQNQVSVIGCDAALGLEPWWTYLNGVLGATTNGHVNVANGNLVVTADDSTPVQAHGRLALSLRRAYNSQDTSALASLPGSFGDGWLLSVGETDALAGLGVTGEGLAAPSLQSLARQVTQPLDVTLIDRDGTRHVFTPSFIAAAAQQVVTGLPASLAAVKPLALALPNGYNAICVDVTYQPPPGVHLGLWRYIAVNGTCSNRNAAPIVLGYGAERPDRLRTEYDATGRLLAMSDGAGSTLRYVYNEPSTSPASGALAVVYDDVKNGSTSVCTPNSGTSATVSGPCRQIRFSYPNANEIDAVDTSYHDSSVAGRQTKYLFHTDTLTLNGVTGSVKLLDEVDNPDQADGTAGSKILYSYQGESITANGPTSCGGSPGQMCSTTDERGNRTTFTYTSAPLGLPRLATWTNRRGYATTFSYASGQTTVTANGGAVPGRQTVYSAIDQTGRVGQILAGGAGVTASSALRDQTFFWDQTSTGAPCRQPTGDDNNLCETKQAGSANSGSSGIATPDTDTLFTYDDAGMLLSTTRSAGRAAGQPADPAGPTTLVTSSGYHRQWATNDSSTPVATGDETVGAGGAVSTATAPTGPVFYTLADRTQSLPPRGAAAGSNWQQYLTTYTVDDTTAAPNTSPSGGTCTATGAATGNTGLVCATSAPYGTAGPTGSAPQAVTVTRYDSAGQLTSRLTPNGHDNSGTPYTYTYVSVFGSDGTTPNTDLSGATPSGGWLARVTDPNNHFVAFGYDAAGNVVRSWDRDATIGHSASNYPGTLAAAGPGAFSQTLYGPGTAAQAIAHPWRWARKLTDPVGDATTRTVDELGDVTAETSPNGNTTSTRYDADGNPFWTLTPAEAGAGSTPDAPAYTTYDAFDEPISITSPNASRANALAGHAPSTSQDTPADAYHASRTMSYDTVGQLVATTVVRGPSSAVPTPSNCLVTTSIDGPTLDTGQVACTSTAAYDTLGNQVATQDPAGQTSTAAYDAASRVYRASRPRDDTLAADLFTKTNLDADGNPVDSCNPRQTTEANGTCDSSSVYAVHTTYDLADRPIQTVRHRDNSTTLTSSATYDADGNTISSTNPNGTTATSIYSPLDRLLETASPRSTGPTGTTVHAYRVYSYSGDLVATMLDGLATDNTAGNGAAQSFRITGYTYDAAHRRVDTVTGLQAPFLTSPTASNPNAAQQADLDALQGDLTNNQASAGNGINTRTRNVYDSDGNIVGVYSPRAFNTADGGSVTAPNATFLLATGYDADDRPITQWTPRFATGANAPANSDDPNTATSTLPGTQCPADPTGLPAGLAYPSGTHVCVAQAGYDPDGNLIRQVLPTNPDGSGDQILTATYTSDDLLRSVTGPDPSAATGTVTVAAYTYDADGRQLTSLDANGIANCTSYNSDGTVAAQVTASTTTPLCDASQAGTEAHRHAYRYDGNGNQTRDDAVNVNVAGTTQNLTTTTSYTADDLVASVATPGSHVTGGVADTTDLTSYGYDANGNPTSVTSPSANATDANNPHGLPTVNTYTADNLLADTYTPIADPTGLGLVNSWRHTAYSYDPEGDKTGTTTSTVTGAANNPTLAQSTGNGGSQGFTYYPNGLQRVQQGRSNSNSTVETITDTYDAAGNLSTATDVEPVRGTGTAQTSAYTTSTTATYYLDGLTRSVTESGRTTTASYTGDGQVAARSSGDANGTATAATTFTHADQPATLTDSAAANPWQWSYDVGGRPVSQTNANGTTQTYAYTPGQDTLASTTISDPSGTTVSRFAYSYDEAFRILTQRMTGQTRAGAAIDTTYTYTYWPSGAIRSYRNGNGAVRNYSYDHDRNRLNATDPNGTSHTYTYRADDAIATDTPAGLAARTFSYDDDGRLTSDGCNAYDYDGFDRTAAIYPASSPAAGCPASLLYSKSKYDGLDRQAVSIHTTGAVTTTTSIGYEQLSSTLDTEIDSGAISGMTRYALDPSDDALAVKRTSSSGTGASPNGIQQLSEDGNGSIATITDSAGALACDRRYDPYGEPDGNGSPATADPCGNTVTADTLGYNSVRTDSISGTQQLGSRTYSPSLGGFTTPDDYRAAPSDANVGIGTDPLTRNTYTYVNGDPVNLTDPTGHMPCADDYNGQSFCYGNVKTFGRELQKRDQREFVAHAQYQAAQLVVRQVLAYRNANFYFNTHNVSWNCSEVAPTLGDKCQQANAYGRWIATLESLPATQLSQLDKWALRDWVNGPAAGGVTDDPWGNAIVATVATLGLLGPEEAAAGASEGAIEQGGSRALSAASSRLLGKNLEGAGFERGEDVAAHHIVAGGAARAAEARAVLARFGIDINSAENGVFLPADTASPNLEGAAVHATVHTAAYYETVNALLGEAVSREEALDVLNFVRNQLLSGGLPSMVELAGAGG